jgi:uncharacterized protein
MDLTCPKCHGAMRTYERNGVHVDQCTECRGIFLDRGELERLVAAENSWHSSSQQPRQPGSGQRDAGQGLGAVVGEVLQQARAQRPGSQPYRHPKKKKSFLDELFG